MARFLYNLILMSISGSVMYMLALAVRKLTKNKFSGWYYYLLVTAVVLLTVPLQAIFTIPKIVNIEISNNFNQVIQSTRETVKQINVSPITVIFLVWFAVTAICVISTAIKYFRSYKNLKAISEETYDEQILSAYREIRGSLRISSDIKIMTSANLLSPLLFGVMKPVIIIPARQFTYNELKMIFAHELTHYKHKDLLIKLVMSLAMSVHWFNPLVYILAKSMNECCELCCDECVLKTMDLSDKKDYGRLLISVIEHTSKRRYAYTTAMASPKNDIQKRLTRIAEFKNTSKVFKTAGAMLAVSMTVCSVTAFGFSSAKEVLPEPVAEFIEEAVTKPVITALPTPEVNQDYSDYAQNSDRIVNEVYTSPSYEETAEDPIGETTEIYPAADTETSEPIQEDISNKADSAYTVDISNSSIGFSADFTENGQSMESVHTYTASSASIMAVYASSGSVKVTDADTGEVIYDGNGSDETTARIHVEQGKNYRVGLTSDTDGESKINAYVYGYNEE